MREDPSDDQPVVEPALPEPAWRRLASRAVGWPRSIPALFLLLGVPFGLFFAFLVPPGQVPDEPAHFLRVWKIADGDLIADYRFDPVEGFDRQGGVFDACVRQYVDEFYAIASTSASYDVSDYWFDTPDCSPQQRSFEFQDAHGDYGIWSYPGQTIGVAAGRAAGLPLPVTFFLGRLTALALYLALGWSALRLAPRGNLALFVVALLPMSLSVAAGYSTDGVIIGASLVAVAAILRAALDREAAWRSTLVALVALGAVVLTKPPYAPLLLLLALVPSAHYASPRRGWAIRLGGALGILLAVAVWRQVSTPPVEGTVFRDGVDQVAQAKEILRHPLGFIRLSWRTFVSASSQEFVMQGWVGQFGMLRTGRPQTPLMGAIAAMAASLLLGATYATERGAVVDRSRAARWRALLVVAVLAATFFAIYAGLFVIWNPLGSMFIEGVQGRYFVPLLALPPLWWALRRERAAGGVGRLVVAASSCALLLAAVAKVRHFFY